MCEICGGPHFTCLCPDYSRSSAPLGVTNYSMHAQTYFSQEYPISSDAGRLNRIEGMLTKLISNNALESISQERIIEKESLLQQNQMMKAAEDIRRNWEKTKSEWLQQKSGNDLYSYPKLNTFYNDSDEIMDTQPTHWFSGNKNSSSTFSSDSC